MVSAAWEVCDDVTKVLASVVEVVDDFHKNCRHLPRYLAMATVHGLLDPEVTVEILESIRSATKVATATINPIDEGQTVNINHGRSLFINIY